MMARNALVLLAVPLALAACHRPAQDPKMQDAGGTSPQQAQVAAGNPAKPLPGASMSPAVKPTGAADDPGAPFLDVIARSVDADFGVAEECAFTVDGNAMLLMAGATGRDNSRGKGAVRIKDLPRIMSTEQLGGPDYIRSGPVLTDGEFTVKVIRGAGAGAPMGKGRQWPATLTVRKGLGPVRTYAPGQWTCGV